MGLFSAIASFITGVCSAIGAIASSIGLAKIGMLLTAAITALNPIIGLIIAAIPLVLKILEMVAPKEVKPKDIESGELAVKAESCKDIKPESYKTTSEYIKAVQESIESNPEKRAWIDEKMNSLTPEEKDAYKLVSVGMAGVLVAEKLNTEYVDPAFIAKANAAGLDAEKTISFIKELSAKELSTSDANAYFDGNLGGDAFEKARDGVKSAMGKMDTSLTTEEQLKNAVTVMFEKIEAAEVEAKEKLESGEA